MSRIKYLSGAVGLLLALAIGLGAPSAANAQTNRNSNNNTNSNNTTVNAECGGDFNNTQVAGQSNDADNSVTSLAGVMLGTVTGGSNNQSNSTTQTATFAPRCNVVRQVQAPRGAVKAGAGAAAAPLFGFSGSLASAAYGIYR